jgi:hypothetical protein
MFADGSSPRTIRRPAAPSRPSSPGTPRPRLRRWALRLLLLVLFGGALFFGTQKYSTHHVSAPQREFAARRLALLGPTPAARDAGEAELLLGEVPQLQQAGQASPVSPPAAQPRKKFPFPFTSDPKYRIYGMQGKDTSNRCRQAGICDGEHAPNPNDPLAHIVTAAERREVVRQATKWTWSGYR